MKKAVVRSIVFLALCALALSGEAFAQGGAGGGGGMGLSSGNALRTKTMTQSKIQTKTQVKSQQRLRDGSALGDATASAGGAKGQQQRKLGIADGSDTPLQPLDGTGYGSSNNQ